MPNASVSERLQLHGFNNLTKSLSFNIYDVCYAKSEEEKKAYVEYIDEEYNADGLTEILVDVTKMIGARVLNIARQDYEPQGASVTILVGEHGEFRDGDAIEKNRASSLGLPDGETVLAHLDKSHICVHTYPEYHPDKGICTFRADVEVSTCGMISPLHSLNYLIREFDADVLNIDYRVRGFTRDVRGKKFFIDHKINSIQNFIDKSILKKYQAVDVNVYQENLYHTKMMWKKVDLDRYLFGGNVAKKAMGVEERQKIRKQLSKEIQEIFYGTKI